jgi:hypothetical protein
LISLFDLLLDVLLDILFDVLLDINIAEETHYENIVAEMALAHGIDSKVERSYRRGDLLKRRKSMMELYSNYVYATPQSKVVSITG